MKYKFAWSLGCCISFVASSAQAQVVVKCTSAAGDVTYSDTLCQRAEKTAVVDTRASSNVLDYSFIRAQKSRVFASVAAAPTYSAPSSASTSSPAPAPFTVDRQPRPVSYTR